MVEPEVARQIRRDLSDLEEALAALSPATLATLRAGFLARSGLLHDARLGAAEGLGRRPDEPTLHFLLGDLYARLGLSREAAESFAEVSFLMSGAVSAR